VRRFHRLIAAVVLRTASRLGDSSVQTVDDLIQDTYLKLCGDNFRLLREFDERHPNAFLGYVRVVAANVVRDHFKSSHSKKRGTKKLESISDDVIPAAEDGSTGSARAIERAVLFDEVQRHLELCIPGPDHDRNARVFWLYYQTGLSAGAIAALPGISLTTKGVESVILRITRLLKRRLAETEPRESKSAHRASKGTLPAESF
jgi:RNA polymerase sigma-70 factor (ECF subfamily)